MRYDSRLPRVLHVLLHLRGMDRPATSALIGQMLHTDAAFVRRTMAGLRDRGWVSAARGHGGGWELATPLSEISLLDLYEALGSPPLFALGQAEDAPRCLMERAANSAVDRALSAAEATFRASLAGVTVADLATDFEARLRESGHPAWVPDLPGDAHTP
jgi:DNA-binding IscR family transcriptional regulator